MFGVKHNMQISTASYDQGIPVEKLKEMLAKAEHGYAKAMEGDDKDRQANALRIVNERKRDLAAAQAKESPR